MFQSYLLYKNDVVETLIMKVKAVDADPGENGRITYHFKVNDSNVQETDEFMINEETGELKAKIILDRETKPQYQVRFEIYKKFE